MAAFNRMEGRDVIDAKLGCPVCSAEYFIRDGVALFGDGPQPAGRAADDPAHSAAFLNLTAPGKTVLLAGAFSANAAAVATIAEARVISLNAPHTTRLDQVAEIRCGGSIPLETSSLDGIALDNSHAIESFLSEAERLLRPGGRFLAPASATLPPTLHALARDSNHIVAEKATELISLGRKP